MVARALLLRPRLIIADEPVSMVDASLRATILESLLQAASTNSASRSIYITHDLTTAYQISDNIVVLYRGAVAEAGDVEEVVERPRHPTRSCSSTPFPEADVHHRWADGELLPAVEVGAPSGMAARSPAAVRT